MEVAVVGGGPGGLFASLLLKRDHPEWTVTVYEANEADVTYGWGIVFPARTLSNLEAADPDSHHDIADEVTRWQPFDLYHKGRRFRSTGHTFASLLRTDLLEILQQHARTRGVQLEFATEISAPKTLAEDVDLLIGADGIHSTTREAYAAEFGARKIEGETRFSWFGTRAEFEALSHVFVENEAGIWCAHTYPGPVRTFIIDCDAETWRNAGLTDMTEEGYLQYLESLFDEYLDGHELLSQQDRWRRFTTVKNRTWSHRNVVLIGDAAHTAHYSIGSGTTIAMEDAIALAAAFDEKGVETETALSAYEAERQPVARSLQLAGERSRVHFENIRRFYDLEGIQFVMHHLTRSGRLTYESMARRDPALVEEFEEWFASRVPKVPEPARPNEQPFKVGDLVLPNRRVAVMEPTYASEGGHPSPAQCRGFIARDNGDHGLVLTDPLAISQDGRVTPGSPGLYTDAHRTAWAEAVGAVDVPTGVQLYHAGHRGGMQAHPFALERPVPRNESWAPRLADQYPVRPGRYVPDRMNEDDLRRIRESYVRAAERADAAGFDYLQLHIGNGYLLGSFLSPQTNDRTDEFGGSLDGRMRFPVEVVEAVKASWPDGKPLGAAVQVTDWADGGPTMGDTLEVCRGLIDAGIDVIAPVVGKEIDTEDRHSIHGLANYTDHIRNELGVSTMATVQAVTTDEVNTLVGTGRADLCTYFGATPPR